MMTVHEVAEHYGVSDAFVVAALDRLGFRNAKPDTALATPTLTRFEAEYGEKIRAKRADAGLAPDPAPVRREPKPHVMRVAHAKVTGGRDPQGFRVKKLLDDPGPVHAIDPVGTWNGDPWRGEVMPGRVHFYGGPIGTGPRAACGVVVRAVLGDEFVPDYDPAYPFRSRQCPRCAELVADGKGFRSPPGSYDPFCYEYLHVKIDGKVEVQECSMRGGHRGPHRTRDGATWDIGFDDFVPAPLDAGCRITKAS